MHKNGSKKWFPYHRTVKADNVSDEKTGQIPDCKSVSKKYSALWVCVWWKKYWLDKINSGDEKFWMFLEGGEDLICVPLVKIEVLFSD